MTDIATDLPGSAGAAKPRTRRLPLIIFGTLALVGASWGVRQYLWGRHHVSSDNAQLDGHITAIAPRIPGFIARVLVDDNRHVKAGDTLVVLDDRDLLVRL